MKQEYTLAELFDIDKLQSLCDSISSLNGIAMGIRDLEGNLIIESGFVRLCTSFHKGNPGTREKCNCRESIISTIEENANYRIYNCQIGLTEVVIPISLEGNHIGDLFAGQFFLEKPDQEFFIRQANTWGFDESDYLKAVQEVPIITREMLIKRTAFLVQLSHAIADLAFKNQQNKAYSKQYIKAKEHAEEINKRFEFATSIGRVGTWDWDLITDDLVWSSETYRILGYEPFSVKPSYDLFLELVHQDDRQYLDENVKAAWHEKKPYAVDCRIVLKNNEQRICNATGKVEFNEVEEPVRMIGTFQDITERIKIQEELQRSNAKLERIFLVAPTGIGQVINRVITDVNIRFCEMIGYTPEELIGQNSLIIYPSKEEYEFVGHEKYAQISRQGTGTVETRMKKKSGEIIDVLLASTPLDVNDISKGTIFTALDITDRKRYEEQLKRINEDLQTAIAKADESNRLKTKFLHNMSHEIRTPMNGIIGFSEMLDNPNLTEEKRKSYLKVIQNSSHQLLKIIDDILEISSLETSSEKIHVNEFSLNELIDELLSIFKLKTIDREVPIHTNKAFPDHQDRIVTDKSKLHKILSNLIENAIKFTHEGLIEIGYYLKDNNLVLYVKDTGVGISPKNKESIFERFIQEEKEMSKKFGGLGLGLSISKENARLLDGDITVDSVKGKGSTFYVTIPYQPVNHIAKVSSGAGHDLPQNAADLDLFHVLVADDEELNYLYIEALLEGEFEHIGLIHARNGLEAVEICAENDKIDLILMDIKMPIMDGHEAAQKIKSTHPDLPIIAQTAYSTETDKQLALDHGCDDFISKPLSKEILLDMIRSYLKVK